MIGAAFNQGDNRMTSRRLFVVGAVLVGMLSAISPATAQGNGNCSGLPSYTDLKNALTQATKDESSGFDLNMWASTAARDGTVCAVAFLGNPAAPPWLGI